MPRRGGQARNGSRASSRRRLAALVLGTGVLTAVPAQSAFALALQASGFAAVEGSPFAGTLATFTDTGVGCQPANYTATVTWPDGVTSPGAIGAGTPVANSLDCTYPVKAGHTFVEELTPRSFQVSVTGGLLVATTVSGSATASVVDAPLGSSGVSINANEGAAFGATVATFTDADPNAALGDFSATVAWSDGTSSPGVVAADPSGTFAVFASRAFTQPGGYTATATIIDGGASQTTATAAVTVADLPLRASGAQVNATEGQAFAATLATFSDADAGRPAAYYGAVIDWGDGTTSGGAVAANPAGAGFAVGGSHAYATPGSYTATVAIRDPGGPQIVVATGLVVVADAPLSSTPVQVGATEGALLSATVASFHDADAGRSPGHYTAQIDWADGTPTSAGAIAPDGVGGFLVSGTHAYLRPGSYPVKVTVADADGQMSAAVSAAVVADAALTAVGVPLQAVAGAAFQTNLATFTDADPNAGPANFTATIAWGDGTTTADPAITPDPGGGFDVGAGHTYDRSGTFAATVTVRDTAGSQAPANVAVTVAAPPPPPPPPPPPTITPTTPVMPAPAPKGQPPAPAAPPPIVGLSSPRLLGTSTLALRLTCPVDGPRCRGVARVIILPARSRTSALRGGTSLGSALFLLASGESRTVYVPVAKRLRRVLRQARSVRLDGVAIAFGAGGHNAAAVGPIAVISTTGLR